jgi:hypothetical protein
MKMLALVAGIFFLLLGIAGFIPSLAANGLLFGVFPVHTTHSIIYLIAGVVGVMIGVSRRKAIVAPRAPGHDMRDLTGV